MVLKSGLLLLLISLSANTHAAPITIETADIYAENSRYYLDAKFNIQLTEAALTALKNGISLTFYTQFQLQLERKWLWDEDIDEVILKYKIEYQPLTGNYLTINLETGARRLYEKLETALRQMGSITKLYLFSTTALPHNDNYIARLKCAIDLESLPLPIRPLAYFSTDWNMKSKWHQWSKLP